MTYNHTGAGNWITNTETGLTASDFVDVFEASTAFGGSGAIVNPDFSSSGAPIHFGYMRANCCGGFITLTHRIDNWSVTINAVEVSAPSGLAAIFYLGLFALAAARLREVRI